jgi:prepilin-type N-terminal cleavage/methylation domain-containing protein
MFQILNFLPARQAGKFQEKGFTLLEIIVSLFIVTVGMGGVFIVIQRSFTIMSISGSRLVAANLAQEGIEVIRNIRDTNWLEGGSVAWDEGFAENNYQVQYDDNKSKLPVAICSPNPCDNYDDTGFKFLKIDANGFYNYDTGDATKFKRRVTISDKTADSMKITVDVIWKERGGIEYNYTAYHWLYDWK